jgi:hypothetical protein
MLAPSLKHRFITWLQEQPPEKEYRYSDARTCACGQFARAIGEFKNWNLGDQVWRELDAYAWSAHPRTFGKILAQFKRYPTIKELRKEYT